MYTHKFPDPPSGRGGKVTLPLAPGYLRAIAEALALSVEGQPVSFAPSGEELTTTEAAELLNVSRPHLRKLLLGEGEIPHHMAGTHHRVQRRDVLAYKRRQRAGAEEAMQALADQAQELALGHWSFLGGVLFSISSTGARKYRWLSENLYIC